MRQFAAAFLLFLPGFTVSAWAQTLPSVDTTLNSVIARHGGTALNVANTQIQGAISYAGGGTHPFLVTLQGRASRCEVQGENEVAIVLRQDLRTQVIHGQLRDHPERSSRAFAAFNVSPALALVNFKSDDRFTASTVQSAQGLFGVRFAETPKPAPLGPSFAHPKLSATFWLDSSYRIIATTYEQSATYGYDASWSAEYRYGYDAAVTGPFLQPSSVEFYTGGASPWAVRFSSASVNLLLASDFFKIVGANDEPRTVGGREANP